MMLNPAKCVFGVPVDKLLGFLVSNRGIEANTEKIKAITSLTKPACINDVQRLAGCIIALSRFISRLGEKAILLYQMMKKTDRFVWSDAADAAFEVLKRQLVEPPVLAAPVDNEPLLLYVVANARAVSVAIVVERKEVGKEYPVQRPVYYISEVLIESKQRYLHWQKLIYGVFMANRKLKQYFQGHPITMVSSASLGDIIQNREATGRVAKWAIELSPHELKYVPRTAIKSQALVDFINDWTELQTPEEKPDLTYWTIHFDGSKQLEGSGAGVVFTSPRGDKFCYVLRLMFPCTNNAAEYEALLHGLRIAKEMNLSRVTCLGDSDLVAQQVSGKWDSRDPLMAAYRREVEAVAGYFKGYQVEHIDRRKNEAADALSRLGSQRKPVPPNTFLDELHSPSVKVPSEEDLDVPDPEAQLVATLHVN